MVDAAGERGAAAQRRDGRRRQLEAQEVHGRGARAVGARQVLVGDGRDRGAAAGAHFRDPFEYLANLHKDGRLRTDFRQPLGRVALHAACHQRVQNLGNKAREVLSLVPGTELTVLERCSGHDGTYAVRAETHPHARKLCRPLLRQLEAAPFDHYGSDCPLAGAHLRHVGERAAPARHPLSLLHQAYGLGAA